ncbi:HET-domain-containing protein [Apiospora arundinis]|uniref:Ankyrin repeat domain protein n=1 Tax=Apiospora arundinis TaxID=335852 RepID=A0ABR2IFL0_9PEZI
MDPLSAVSPATSSATNRTNRGGRPKEWTDPRARRLARLYVYTSLKVEQILDILEEDVFTPGKEAASKHLNKLLGKDPRWMRPKDVNEQREIIGCLKKSERATKHQTHRYTSEEQRQAQPGNALHNDNYPQVKSESIDGATIATSSVPSIDKSEEKSEQFDFYNCIGPNNMQAATFNSNASRSSFGRFFPKSPNRQGTTLTTSTNFSIGSNQEAYHHMREKLESDPKYPKYERSDLKDIFRVLKRFTLSVDANAEKSQSSSPIGQRQHAQENGLHRAYNLPSELLDVTPLFQSDTLDIASEPDQYGNTTFHQLAAATGFERALIGFVEASSHNQHYRNTLATSNTAGQTLLHVLHDGWFENEALLNTLLNALRGVQFDFYVTDVYGRSFFHILRQKLGADRIRSITHHFDLITLNRRDAFGIRPMIGRSSTIPSRQEGPPRLTIPIPRDANEEKIKQEAEMLKLINQTLEAPFKHTVEDSQGRNGLHCLAEVKLGAGAVQGLGQLNRSAKRKIDSNDEPGTAVLPLSRRAEFLATLLDANTDVNHYNMNGDTVLMAFVNHTSDDSEHEDLKLIIKRLLDAGAKLEARNRSGETALHVAARLGRKYTVRVLLEHGANTHVRNHEGVSILEGLDRLVVLTDDDTDLYARLEATRAMLTGRFVKTRPRSRSEQSPSPEQEWGIRHGL